MSGAEKKGGVGKPLALVGAAVVLIALGIAFDVPARFKDLLAWVDGLGPIGPIVFIVAYILACVLFLPGSVLTLGAGAVFGVVMGFVYVSLGSVLGATAAFLVGRYFARDMIAKKIEGNEKFGAIDKAVGREGWKIVGLTRLSPIFPFNLLNYAYGLTSVSLRDYFFASWIGMIPGTIMFVYIGSLAKDIATLGGERTRSAAEWALYIVGLLATVAVSAYVTKVARRAMQEHVGGAAPAGEAA